MCCCVNVTVTVCGVWSMILMCACALVGYIFIYHDQMKKKKDERNIHTRTALTILLSRQDGSCRSVVYFGKSIDHFKQNWEINVISIIAHANTWRTKKIANRTITSSKNRMKTHTQTPKKSSNCEKNATKTLTINTSSQYWTWHLTVQILLWLFPNFHAYFSKANRFFFTLNDALRQIPG